MPEHEPDDVLSQDEVNELLSDLAGAEGSAEEQAEAAGEADEPGPAISIYDFRRPDILSAKDLQVLTADGARIAEAANRRLVTLGFDRSRLDLTSVDLLTLDEYVRSLSNPCFVVPFTYPRGAIVAVEFAPAFAVQVAHAVMGLPVVGSPSLGSLPALQRRALAATAASAFADALAKGGQPPDPGEPIAAPLELQPLPLGTTVCVLTFSTDSGSPSLAATLIIGRPALETFWRSPAAGSEPADAVSAAFPDLVLRRTLRFPVPGVTGSKLRALLDTGNLDVCSSTQGRVAYEEE